jgi:DNA-binding GntR family transcriptional regulator
VSVLASDSPQLLHRQVYRLIADWIASGELEPGQRLPSERNLAAQLSVSRVTIRRALRELAEAGLIESSVGRGSFVSGGPLAEPPNALMGFSELGAARGFTPTARVLSVAVRPAEFEEAELFGVAPGSEIFDVERLRLLDGVPTAVDRSRVPLSRAPGLAGADFSKDSLYAVLDAEGVGPVRAEYTVHAAPADGEQAGLLGLEIGASLLVTQTTAFDNSGRLVELAVTAYPGDRYRFRATLIRRRELVDRPGGGSTPR